MVAIRESLDFMESNYRRFALYLQPFICLPNPRWHRPAGDDGNLFPAADVEGMLGVLDHQHFAPVCSQDGMPAVAGVRSETESFPVGRSVIHNRI